MGFSEKINVIFNADTRGFSSGIKSLRADVANADGAMGKLKAGASGLGETLRQNAGAAALVAGTALVTFGVKAVSAFQDAALGAGKFADATGLAVSDASRWIEVAGDIGIEAGTIQGAFQKLNKAIADGKPALTAYGVEIVKTKDGVVDSNATFINAATTIGAIVDPTKRAQAAQEVFGKSYGEVAELMEMSASDLRTALGGVSDAKVIDEAELERARNFRETMGNLRDKLEDFAIVAGEVLVPALEDVAGQVASIAENAKPLLEFLWDTGAAAAGSRDGMEQLEQTLFDLAPAIEQAGLNFEDTFFAVTSGAMTMDELNDKLLINVDVTDRAANKAEYYANAADLAASATSRAASAIDQTRVSADRQERSLASLSAELDNYIASVEDVPEEWVTAIRAAIDAGDIRVAEALLNEVTRPRIVQVGIALNQGALSGAVAAGAAGGKAIGAGIAAALAGVSMPSSVGGGGSGGGGGGGGGGASSPAETEAEKWDAAIAKAYEYGEVTAQEYINYLSMRMEGEDRYSDAYFAYWQQRKRLEDMLADQAEKRRKDQEDAEKEAADAAAKAAKDAQEATKAIEAQQKAQQNATINVYSNSLDPMAIARAIEQARRMIGNRFLGG